MWLEKVAYTSEHARWAVSFRREARRVHMPVGGKNVCSVGVQPCDGGVETVFTFVSEPPGTKDVPSAHSEMVGLRALRWQFEQGARLTWLYTERQPCGSAVGHANCTSKLEEALQQFGAYGPDTPVYFTFDYPTARDLHSLIDEGLLSEEEARDMAREECQCSTIFIMDMDKTIGEQVPSWAS